MDIGPVARILRSHIREHHFVDGQFIDSNLTSRLTIPIRFVRSSAIPANRTEFTRDAGGHPEFGYQRQLVTHRLVTARYVNTPVSVDQVLGRESRLANW